MKLLFLFFLLLIKVVFADPFNLPYDSYILFQTNVNVTGTGVNVANCQNTALALGFSNSPRAKPLAVFLGFLNENSFNVYGPTGIFIGTANTLRTNGFQSSSFQDAKINCTTVWSGYTNPDDPDWDNNPEENCLHWSSNAVGVRAYTADCTSLQWKEQSGTTSCDNILPYLCYYPTDVTTSAPSANPTKSPTLRPTLPPTTFSPTQAFPPDSYIVFATQHNVTGNYVNDTNCVDSATFHRLPVPSRAKALVAYNMNGWEDARNVYGPTGVFIASGSDFRTDGVQAVTLQNAVAGCSGLVWAGFFPGSFGTLGTVGYSCSSWTTHADNIQAVMGTCSSLQWKDLPPQKSCDQAFQYLCYYPTDISTSAPSQSPTQSPTPRANYVVFATTSSYYGYEVTDQHCQDTATTLGFVTPSSAWALVAGSPNLASWDLTLNVVGPTGLFIASSYNFINQGFNNAKYNRSLVQAGVDCSELWTGFFAPQGFATSSADSCEYWQVSVGSAGSQDGRTYDCDSMQWGTALPIGKPGYHVCTDQLKYLCVYSGATSAPTLAPTTLRPTSDKRPAYTIFATPASYTGDQVNDAHCRTQASALGFYYPSRAWALIAGSPKLATWDDERDVQGPTSLFITRAKNFRTQEFPLARTLEEAGVGCSGELFVGMANFDFTNSTYTCYSWTSNGFYGAIGFCNKKEIWKFDNTAQYCGDPRQYLCVYEDEITTASPTTHGPTTTKSPTTPTVTTSPTPHKNYVVFATSNSYTGGQVKDSNCWSTAATLGFPNPNRAWAYVYSSTNLTEWDFLVDVVGPTGIYITNARNFYLSYDFYLNEHSFSNTLQNAGVACSSTVWSGLPTSTDTFGQVVTDCFDWTDSNYGFGELGSCTSIFFDTRNADLCYHTHQHLCVTQDDPLPTPSPTSTSPTPPTYSTVQYTVFQTTRNYTGNHVNDSNCAAELELLGYAGVTPWALVAGNPQLAYWDDSTSIFTLQTADFMDSSLHFRTRSTALTSSLQYQGLCRGQIWTGFNTGSFTSNNQTCSTWTSSLSNATGVLGDCNVAKEWANVGIGNCTRAYPYLCAFQGSAYPILQPNYVVFATNQRVQGNQISDANCHTTAYELGFAHPENTWAFVSTASNLTIWGDNHRLVGPTGLIITTSSGALRVPEDLTFDQRSYAQARVCNGGVWTGFSEANWIGQSCTNWTSASGGQQGIIGDCDLRDKWGIAALVPCSNTYPHLCINPFGDLPNPTLAPATTQSPTASPVPTPTSSPTLTPTPAPSRSPVVFTSPIKSFYRIFATTKSYVGSQVSDDGCRDSAFDLGLDPANVWALIWDEASWRWNDTRDVYSLSGVYLSTGLNFRRQTHALNSTLKHGGLTCDSVWTGFFSQSFEGEYKSSCGGWTIDTAQYSGNTASCNRTTFWGTESVERCDLALPYLCVYEGLTPSPVQSPTKSPTVPTSSSPTTQFPTKSPSVTPPTLIPTTFFSKAPTTLTPTRAPTTKTPTSVPPTHVPTPGKYIVYATQDSYSFGSGHVDQYEQGCISTAASLKISAGVPLIGWKYLRDDGALDPLSNWEDNRDIWGPDGIYITDSLNFRTQTQPFFKSLKDARVGCSKYIWTGFIPSSFNVASPEDHDSIVDTVATIGTCETYAYWNGQGALPTSTSLQILCYTTGNYQQDPVTHSPTTHNQYVVYVTDNVYRGNEIRDSNCHVPGSKALVANSSILAQWNDAYDVVGPTGEYITSGGNFRTQLVDFDRSLLGAGIVCTQIWTGFIDAFDSFSQATCDIWTTSSSSKYGSYGLCGDTIEWSYYTTTTCNDQLPHLCVYVGAPFQAIPTTSPTTQLKYYIYSSSASLDPSIYLNTYPLPDSTCYDDARALGFPYPTKAWALIALQPNLIDWDDNRMVVGPTGTVITDSKTFRLQNAPFTRSLSQAGACNFDSVSTGFVKGSLTGYAGTTCIHWHGNAYPGVKFSTWSCTSTLPYQSGLGECSAFYKFGHLCVMQSEDMLPSLPPSQTLYPSQLPTSSYPTIAPTPAPTVVQYMMFLTEDKHASYDVNDNYCQVAAFNKGLTNPKTAWAFISNAANLARIDYTKVVVNENGTVMGTASSVFQNGDLLQTLQSFGFSCDLLWLGIRHGLSETITNCNGWGLSSSGSNHVTGAATSCSWSNLYKVPGGFNGAGPYLPLCSTQHKYLCIYGGETPTPTAHPTSHPTISCSAIPTIISSYAFTDDFCELGQVFDTARPGNDPIFLDENTICMNRTLTLQRRTIENIGITKTINGTVTFPIYVGPTYTTFPWTGSCKALETWVSVENTSLPTGGSYVLIDQNGFRLDYIPANMSSATFSFGNVASTSFTPVVGNPVEVFVQQTIATNFTTICIGIPPSTFRCANGTFTGNQGSGGSIDFGMNGTLALGIYQTSIYSDCLTESEMYSGFFDQPLLGVETPLLFAEDRVEYVAEPTQ